MLEEKETKEVVEIEKVEVKTPETDFKKEEDVLSHVTEEDDKESANVNAIDEDNAEEQLYVDEQVYEAQECEYQ